MKLQKLILMLSSDSDGEVVAAARAIGRELKANGMDWHGLVARLDISDKPDNSSSTYPSQYVDDSDTNAINRIVHGGIPLNLKERTFIEQLVGKVRLYGKRTFITTRQRAWLHAISERATA